MMADKYSCFAELALAEKLGVDYCIAVEDRDSHIAVVAPHGGYIERGTSEIALAIAGEDFSSYRFEGLQPGRAHGDLHISSERFDEPAARKLVQAAMIAIGVHGRKDGADNRSVWVGGLLFDLRDRIVGALNQFDFRAEPRERGGLAGIDRRNICNCGLAGAGVQLELPLSLRLQLQADETHLKAFAAPIRNELHAWAESAAI